MKIGDKVKCKRILVYTHCGKFAADPYKVYTINMIEPGVFSTGETDIISGALLIWHTSDFEIIESDIKNKTLENISKHFE
jgi:hypothetical protein